MKKKKKTWLVWLIIFVLCFGIAFSGMYMWRYHKARILLMAMETVRPKTEEGFDGLFPPADSLETILSLPSGSTSLPEDGTIEISEELHARIKVWVAEYFDEEDDAGATQNTGTKKRNKRRKNEWFELFKYMLPSNLTEDDIDEKDIDTVAAIVTPKLTMSEALQMAEWMVDGLTEAERQDVVSFLKSRFTEEELTVLIQIYRKYTQMQ